MENQLQVWAHVSMQVWSKSTGSENNAWKRKSGRRHQHQRQRRRDPHPKQLFSHRPG